LCFTLDVYFHAVMFWEHVAECSHCTSCLILYVCVFVMCDHVLSCRLCQLLSCCFLIISYFTPSVLPHYLSFLLPIYSLCPVLALFTIPTPDSRV